MYDNIDIDLLRRYNEPGPRYTSYPTAPVFTEQFGPADYDAEIRATNEVGATAPLSLYAHLPFCDELCYFCGCTMIVTQKADKKQHYLDYLHREIDAVSNLVADKRRVEQLHWGGGTPTDNSPEQISALAAHLHSRFEFAPEEEGEYSCEIDPRGLTRAHLEALRSSGFNRISMGVQDFDERVQKAVNRIQPEAMTRQVVQWCRELGFKSVNLDFIYGLPHQTYDGFANTIDTLIEIGPDRLAMFNFAYVPWMKKHQKQLIDESALPSAEERLRILKMTIERLSAAGYVYIGMDHFSRPDDELAVAQTNKTLQRNFQGYSTKAGCDLYAFGMSGISQLENVYAQNHKALTSYYAAIDANTLPTRAGYQLDRDDHIRREVIMRMMCDSELDTKSIEKRFDIDFGEYFAASLEKLKRFTDEDLVVIEGPRIIITTMGRLVIRNIAMCFDRYLDDLRSGKPIFSRTV